MNKSSKEICTTIPRLLGDWVVKLLVMVMLVDDCVAVDGETTLIECGKSVDDKTCMLVDCVTECMTFSDVKARVDRADKDDVSSIVTC